MEVQNNMLSIAIPFYNAEKYLEKAINSVVTQTYQDWKLILLDDGSTDNSLNIANEIAFNDGRISVISDGQNMNLGFRLNQIPTLVNTKYLMRMDADDIMHPRKVEKQMAIMLNNPDIDVLGTNAYSIDENNMVLGIRYKNVKKNELIDVKGFIHPTIIAKTEWFLKNKYDEKALRIEDSELWYRTANMNNFKMLTEPLFFYREVGKNYYKKYFNANHSKSYVLKKYSNNSFWKKFFLMNLIKGIIYQVFNLFGKEDSLILRRNQIILDKKHLNNFYSDD